MRDTIDMAREAGFETRLRKGKILGVDRDGDYTEELKTFEALVRADERGLAAPAQPEQEPVAKHRDLHSHMMVVAHRAVNKASNNGRESISQKEVVRAICKAIQTNKNLLAKLISPAAQQIDEAHSVGYSNGMTEGYEAGKAYAAAQRQWVELTPEEIQNCYGGQIDDFARALLAKSKERNT
jgi:flagellar biosynthesis/type III secretory pathway protein FliH